MFKKIALIAVVALAFTGLVSTPASAATTTKTDAGTYRTVAHLNSLTKIMASEVKWSLAGCVLNQATSKVLAASKAGKHPGVAVARLAVKQANKQGNGFCKATRTIVATIATLYLTYAAHGKAYIKQTMVTKSTLGFVRSYTNTRWVGKDSKHTVKFSFTV